MKKAGIGLVFVACLLLLAATVHIFVSEDRTAPVIKFEDTRISYGENDDIDVLTEGVNAIDDQDGDVSDTLIIDGIYVNDDGTTAKVIYAARDKQNNIAKASREIDYMGGKITTTSNIKKLDESAMISQTETGTGGDQELASSAESETGKEPETDDEAESGTETESEETEETEKLPEGSPVIKLSTDKVTIEKGESIDQLSYVESITDDEDDTNTLWRRISIDGDQLDRYTAGTYELIYFVIDTDGNKSNEAKLTITVK